MKALGISPLEMRQIIESEFLPLQCECLEEQGGKLMITIHNPDTGQVDLTRRGISYDRFSSSRAILQLVGELRSELHSRHREHAQAS